MLALIVLRGQLDIPTTPPRAQLPKYWAELGSIFPKGSFLSGAGAIIAQDYANKQDSANKR